MADETRKDSTSMKTTAGLTMVYLPSTFIATIFSTQVFQFQADGAGPLIVNVDIWKLIVIAVMFTTMTVSDWIHLNQRGIPHILRRGNSKPSANASAQRKSSNRPLVILGSATTTWTSRARCAESGFEHDRFSTLPGRWKRSERRT